MIPNTKPYPFGNVLSEVCDIWNGSNDTFPGPQPSSIERKHLKTLKNDYMVCDKTDGVRYAFVCCTVNDKKVACIVNRRLDAFIMKVRVPKACAKGTVLDGEVVTNDQGKTIFLVYDCVAMCGVSTTTLPFTERMKHADTFINQYKPNETDAVIFIKKTFFPLSRVEEFLIRKRNYVTDGVILIPNNAHVKTNTHLTYFKLKNGSENTVDFALDCRGTMFLQQHGQLKKTINKITDGSSSHINFDVDGQIIDNVNCVIVECKFVTNKLWTLMLIRRDKNMPNSLYTYKKTLINITENIQVEELVSIVT